MIHKYFYLLFAGLLLMGCKAKASFDNGVAEPPSHLAFTQLLEKHVDDRGGVDYEGFLNDRTDLESYLDQLRSHPPNEEKWAKEDQIAYWLNVYNAFTIDLILDHYPVESIKDIAGGIPFVNTPWDIKFIEIGGETYDLNNVEHGILRKYFDEPLIHVAVNCASVSCPKLLNEAYEGSSLKKQLEKQASFFVNESGKNDINGSDWKLSRILKWYGGDFKDRYGSVEGFIRAFATGDLPDYAEIEYKEYNWKLNVPEAMK